MTLATSLKVSMSWLGWMISPHQPRLGVLTWQQAELQAPITTLQGGGGLLQQA